MIPRIYTQAAPSFAIQSYSSRTVKHRIPSLQSDAGSPVHGTRSAGGEFIPVTCYLDITNSFRLSCGEHSEDDTGLRTCTSQMKTNDKMDDKVWNV